MPAEKHELSGFLERFPAILRLDWLGRRRRIPFVAQTTEVDCGAASLAMVLGYHGRHVSLETVRHATGTGRDGAVLATIVAAAEEHGLRARGVTLEIDQLQHLPPASILFWDFNHYVVFERLRRGAVDIVDPAVGRRTVPLAQFRRHFTGVAATFEPGGEFAPVAREGRTLWHYFARLLAYPGLLLRILFASLLIQIASLALPMLTGAMVDRVLPRGDYGLLLTLALGMAVLVAFQFSSSFLRSHLLLHLTTRLDLQMTLGFVEHLVSLPFRFFQLRSAGDLLTRMNSNTSMREIITSTTLSALLDGVLVTLYLVLLIVASPALAGIAVLLALLNAALFLITRRKQRDLMAESLETLARSSAQQVELLTGIETLKAMGAERHAVQRWANAFVDNLNVTLARGRLNAIFGGLTGALGMASPLVLLLCGGALVLKGSMTLGAMLALSALAAGFLGPINSLVNAAVQLQLLGSYLDRINDVMQSAPEQATPAAPGRTRLRGRIDLEGVSFQFATTAPPVVREVSVAVAPGQHVALVGRTGAGKSTLARLLLGLYEPMSGRVLFDGTDLARLDRRAVRQQMGIVTQDAQLFAGSIRDNIALVDPDLPLESVVRAARLAGLHDEILAMPMGYDTILADRGLSLSGGQRQRLALARALVHEPAILLLDEATSQVDTITERQIHEALTGLRCTRVTIAHRLSTIRNADVILMLKDGVVVEQGTFAALLARGGQFAELVAAQVTPGAPGDGPSVDGAVRRG